MTFQEQFINEWNRLCAIDNSSNYVIKELSKTFEIKPDDVHCLASYLRSQGFDLMLLQRKKQPQPLDEKSQLIFEAKRHKALNMYKSYSESFK